MLVNNAGGIWLKRQLTVDRLEMTFAVNHLAYFLLTHLLRDLLKTSAPARVVNVASRAHEDYLLNFDDLQSERRYDGWQAYCRSKLANVLFTYELARRLEGSGVTANALHPGWVATGFAGNNGWRGRLWQLAGRLFALNPEQGARTVVHLAASPEVEGVSGKYFVREQAVPSSPASYDEAAARRLWDLSLELTDYPAPPCERPASARIEAYVSSAMGSPNGRIGIGRPRWSRKAVWWWSMPRWRNIVAHRSLGDSGRSLGCSPLAVVEPTTCPVRRPPPETSTDIACGQWSRPGRPFADVSRGVRPNSPVTISSTFLSRPRA